MSSSLNSELLFIHGGSNENACTWKYFIDNKKWEKLHGQKVSKSLTRFEIPPIIYGSGSYNDDNNPGPFENGALLTLNEHELLRMFGSRYDYDAIDEIWIFNINNRNWKYVNKPSTFGLSPAQIKAMFPAGKTGFGAHFIDLNNRDEVIIIGGFTRGIGNSNSVLKYDIQNNKWEWLKRLSETNQFGIFGKKNIFDSSNIIPAIKDFASCKSYDQSNEIFIFGGIQLYDTINGKVLKETNNIWSYDINNEYFKWMSGNKNILNNADVKYNVNFGIFDDKAMPYPERNMGMFTDYKGVYVFGGSKYNLNQLWEFDLNKVQWKFISGDKIKGNGEIESLNEHVYYPSGVGNFAGITSSKKYYFNGGSGSKDIDNSIWSINVLYKRFCSGNYPFDITMCTLNSIRELTYNGNWNCENLCSGIGIFDVDLGECDCYDDMVSQYGMMNVLTDCSVFFLASTQHTPIEGGPILPLIPLPTIQTLNKTNGIAKVEYTYVVVKNKTIIETFINGRTDPKEFNRLFGGNSSTWGNHTRQERGEMALKSHQMVNWLIIIVIIGFVLCGVMVVCVGLFVVNVYLNYCIKSSKKKHRYSKISTRDTDTLLSD